MLKLNDRSPNCPRLAALSHCKGALFYEDSTISIKSTGNDRESAPLKAHLRSITCHLATRPGLGSGSAADRMSIAFKAQWWSSPASDQAGQVR